MRDLTEGIDGTDVRAGIIGEIGTDDKYIKPAEERVFRAAARAHKRTGAAVTTHAMGYRSGSISWTSSKRRESTRGG